MNAEVAFQDLGVNAIAGTSILEQLGVTMGELQIPQRFHKLQEVIKYLKQFPEDTQRFLVNKAVRGKMVNKLDHVFEYTLLLKQKALKEEELDTVSKELSVLDGSDNYEQLFKLQEKNKELTDALNLVKEEVAIYEK